MTVLKEINFGFKNIEFRGLRTLFYMELKSNS